MCEWVAAIATAGPTDLFKLSLSAIIGKAFIPPPICRRSLNSDKCYLDSFFLLLVADDCMVMHHGDFVEAADEQRKCCDKIKKLSDVRTCTYGGIGVCRCSSSVCGEVLLA